MYMLVHMMPRCATRVHPAVRALRISPPAHHVPALSMIITRENELASDNRARFAPIELLTTGRQRARDITYQCENNDYILIVRTHVKERERIIPTNGGYTD